MSGLPFALLVCFSCGGLPTWFRRITGWRAEGCERLIEETGEPIRHAWSMMKTPTHPLSSTPSPTFSLRFINVRCAHAACKRWSQPSRAEMIVVRAFHRARLHSQRLKSDARCPLVVRRASGGGGGGQRSDRMPPGGTLTSSSSSSLLLSSLELSDTQVYEPEIRALLGTASQRCLTRVDRQTITKLTCWVLRHTSFNFRAGKSPGSPN